MTTKKMAETPSKTLPDLFLAELADMYDAEQRIAKSLPKMAKAAVSPELQQAVLAHLVETKEHATKIEKIFELFEKKAKSKTCKAAMGLLEEADDIAEEFKDTACNDAALISAMQKVEHYEIASYNCLRAWATLLGNNEAADLIISILNDESAAKNTLLQLAGSVCDAAALGDQNTTGATPKIAAAIQK